MKNSTKAVAITAALGAIAVPTTANAATIAGSGSSANTPYIEALFKEYKKVDKKNTFTYLSNNGNAGVKDVQEGRSAFAIQTRAPEWVQLGTTKTALVYNFGKQLVASHE